MKVRVFLPPVGGGDGDYNGADFDFETMPEVGHMIRTTYPNMGDYKVERVGFIQDGEAFVACVWVSEDNEPDIDSYILSLRGQ